MKGELHTHLLGSITPDAARTLFKKYSKIELPGAVSERQARWLENSGFAAGLLQRHRSGAGEEALLSYLLDFPKQLPEFFSAYLYLSMAALNLKPLQDDVEYISGVSSVAVYVRVCMCMCERQANCVICVCSELSSV